MRRCDPRASRHCRRGSLHHGASSAELCGLARLESLASGAANDWRCAVAKSRTISIVFLGFSLAMVALAGGCVAGQGASDDEVEALGSTRSAVCGSNCYTYEMPLCGSPMGAEWCAATCLDEHPGTTGTCVNNGYCKCCEEECPPPADPVAGCGQTGGPEPNGCNASLCNATCGLMGCEWGTCDAQQRCSCGPKKLVAQGGSGGGCPPGPCSEGGLYTVSQCVNVCGGTADTQAGVCWLSC